MLAAFEDNAIINQVTDANNSPWKKAARKKPLSRLLLRAVPELTGPGVRVGRVRSSDGRGFSEQVTAPTRLSCPGFSRG